MKSTVLLGAKGLEVPVYDQNDIDHMQQPVCSEQANCHSNFLRQGNIVQISKAKQTNRTDVAMKRLTNSRRLRPVCGLLIC